MGKSAKNLCFLLAFAYSIGNGIIYGGDTPAPGETGQSSATQTVKPMPGDIDVTFKVEPRQENGKLYFDVETNLPDGMRFMCAIRDEIGVVYKMGSTMERLMAEVTGGSLTLGPFPFENRSFPSGEYTLYINSYPEQDQPESVVEVIGLDGSNLIGGNVFHGIVIFVKEFMITGN